MNPQNLRILIIDDDDVDRMAICRFLRQASFNTETFETHNAAEAIGLLEQQDFSCIFLDYRLPDTDGIELVRRLRMQEYSLPIIVLTGQGDEQVAVDLMKAGASDYLAKSRLSPDILSSLLRNALNVHRAEQRIRAAQQQLQQTNLILRQQNQELEKQRQQIEKQNLQLLDANQHKSEFLATVTHELRTPLNSIMGFSQILKGQSKGDLNDYQLEMVDRVFSNGKTLLTLVDDLLDMSTLESDHLELSAGYINFTELVEEVVSELRVFAEKKGLDLTLSNCLRDPVIYNDRHRLKQVLTNLVTNAIKFTSEGYVRVEVRSLPRNGLEILVSDTGVGIAEDQLPLIFEPFRQLNQSLRREHSGTGLGLAITSSLITMMEGLISVCSEVGKGTTFRVQLPRQICDVSQSPPSRVPSV